MVSHRMSENSLITISQKSLSQGFVPIVRANDPLVFFILPLMESSPLIFSTHSLKKESVSNCFTFYEKYIQEIVSLPLDSRIVSRILMGQYSSTLWGICEAFRLSSVTSRLHPDGRIYADIECGTLEYSSRYDLDHDDPVYR